MSESFTSRATRANRSWLLKESEFPTLIIYELYKFNAVANKIPKIIFTYKDFIKKILLHRGQILYTKNANILYSNIVFSQAIL